VELLSEVFVALSAMLESSLTFVLFAAFLWGVLSIVLSPCHISSIPLVVGYVNRNGRQSTTRALTTSLYFSGGVLLSLLVIGAITSLMGKMLGDIGNAGIYLVGAVFILTGVWLLDLVRAPVCDVRLASGNTAVGGILMGFVFGAALGPCTFGFMFPVLAVAFKSADQSLLIAISIILAYAIGHSLVIVFAGVGVNQLQRFLNWDSKSRGTLWLKKTCGVLVILTGLYLVLSKAA
jgi:cytochrome c-type biogenesis protein